MDLIRIVLMFSSSYMRDLCFYMTKDEQVVYSLLYSLKQKKKKEDIISLNRIWQLGSLCLQSQIVHSYATSSNQGFLVPCPYSYSPKGSHVCECGPVNLHGTFSSIYAQLMLPAKLCMPQALISQKRLKTCKTAGMT